MFNRVSFSDLLRGGQVFVMAPNGSRQLVVEFDKPPSYGQLDEVIRSGRKAGLEIFKVYPSSSLSYPPSSNALRVLKS
jgi:hypothetical protein